MLGLMVVNNQLWLLQPRKNPATCVDWVYFMAKLIRLKLALIKLYWCQRVYARFPLNGVYGYVWFLA